MTIDPEIRRLHLTAQRAGDDLARRLEGYGKLVPTRRAEAELSTDIIRRVLDAEHMFRNLSERCRNLREMLEDSDLRPPLRDT
jgi:hypothetical protein